jgi:hypothetical protein
MAYYGYGDADIPHSTRKIKTISSTNWVFAFSGQGTAEFIFNTIQSQIESGFFPLGSDNRLSLVDYFSAFDSHMDGRFSTSLLVAGFDPNGEAVICVHDAKTRGTDVLGDVFAVGAQHSTASWLIEMLLPQADSLDDVMFLSHFAIAQVAAQELKVGSPDNYRIDVCALKATEPPRFASAEELSLYASRSKELRSRLENAFKPEGESQAKA